MNSGFSFGLSGLALGFGICLENSIAFSRADGSVFFRDLGAKVTELSICDDLFIVL